MLFADVAGFTSLAEKLDPEDVHRIINGCFERITAEVHRFEGTINQYTRDGVMALFGAPTGTEKANAAVRLAQDTVAAIAAAAPESSLTDSLWRWPRVLETQETVERERRM